jgi:chloramphenicol-sensitive protein RarD
MITALKQQDPVHTGVAFALLAFSMWGFSPLFYRAIGEAPALEILAHRAVWSLLFTLALISISGQTMDFFRLIRNPRIMATLCVSAILVSVNWLGFIWAVNNGKALEASMGYFIMPIVMVLLGRIFLEEHLNRRQLLSLVLVCLGVLNILFTLNQLPWIALLLSVSFGFYSLVRKTVAVNSLAGLTMECLLLSPVAVIYLLYLGTQDQLVFGSRGLGLDLLLAASALMTALPLIFFTSAARRLRLGTVGLIQYINPTCQFMLAVFLFDEPFTRHHLHTFVLIWLGLAMFSLDSRQQMKRMAI